MQVVRNYLYNAFYQVFILLVPLVTTPYLSRVLGPTGIGISAYTNSVIQYFILFGSMGVNLYGNRQIAYARQNHQELTRSFYEIFLMRILTIFLASLAFFVFLMSTSRYHVYYLAQFVSLFAAAFDISWFFMGIEDFAVTVLRNLVVKIVTLISIFAFVKKESDLGLYILLLSVSLLLGNLTLFPSLRKYIGRPVFNQLSVGRHLLPSLALFVPQIATQVYLVVNKTMLGVMTSVQAAGYFDQSDKIIKMTLAIVTATGTVMLPHVANAFVNGDHEKTRKYLYESFSFVSAIAFPMYFGIMAVASKFVPLFFTDRFRPVTLLMIIESIVIILIAWSNAIGTQYLLPTKQTKPYTMSVVLGAIVNIVINIPLITLWGGVGAAIATVLSEVTVTAYQLWVVRNQIKASKLFADTSKYLVAGLVMFVVVKVMDRRLASSWLALTVEIIIGMAIYVFILIILRAGIIKKAFYLLKG